MEDYRDLEDAMLIDMLDACTFQYTRLFLEPRGKEFEDCKMALNEILAEIERRKNLKSISA